MTLTKSTTKRLTKTDFYLSANKKLSHYRKKTGKNAPFKLDLFMKNHASKTYVADTELVKTGTVEGMCFHKGFLIRYDGIYFYLIKLRNKIKYGLLDKVKMEAEREITRLTRSQHQTAGKLISIKGRVVTTEYKGFRVVGDIDKPDSFYTKVGSKVVIGTMDEIRYAINIASQKTHQD
ncbi:hypothetical protein [Photobacterium sanctipauli]|uniref:hypothetical protein n=1 Tax=Photobacterium sanctipauli TaxID=1342794 RepID=UPI0011B27B2C|nr:hypothetical protein [Photobacterium sanctipauli]